MVPEWKCVWVCGPISHLIAHFPDTIHTWTRCQCVLMIREALKKQIVEENEKVWKWPKASAHPHTHAHIEKIKIVLPWGVSACLHMDHTPCKTCPLCLKPVAGLHLGCNACSSVCTCDVDKHIYREISSEKPVRVKRKETRMRDTASSLFMPHLSRALS